MADMATALKGGYADQFKAMLRNPNIPENSLLTRAIHGGAGLVDAYNAWDAPDATTMQGALKYGAMPAKAAVGMGKGMLDVLKGAMDNPEDSMKMLDLASMVAGGGFGAGKMLGGAPKGSIGMNVYQGGPHKYGPEGAAQSLQHMSKGEGAQAYGWGRYDAGAQGVAADYKRTLSGDWSDINRVGDALYDALDPLPNGDVLFKGSKYSKAEFDRVIVPQLDGRDLWGSLPPGLRTATEKKLEGYLYKHDLPDEDIARYLDWDAPLSEQPESVRKAFGYGGGEVKAIDGGFSDGVNTVKITMSKDPVAAGKFQLDGIGPLSDNFGLNRIAAGEDQAKRVATDWLRGASNKGSQAYEKMSVEKHFVVRGEGGNYPVAGKTVEEAASNAGVDASKILLVKNPGDKKGASEALGKAGIPGLKYYDGMNRGMPYKVQPMYKGKPYSDPIDAHGSQVQGLVDDYKAKGFDVDVTEGTRNYVTWDQDVLNRMKLLERNGESMASALGGIVKPVAAAAKRPLSDYGRKLVKTGDRKFKVVDDRGDTAAEIWMREDMAGIADIRVKEHVRGKGLANAAMDEIEKTTGIPLKVTDNLSEQGFNMWQRRDPAQVADSLYHHKDNLLGKTASDGRVSGPIVEVRNEYVSIQPSKGITLPVRKDQLINQGLMERNGESMTDALTGTK